MQAQAVLTLLLDANLKNPSLFRSSCPEVFSEKVALRNFTKFTEKHLCQSFFFNNVAGLRWYSCFPVNFYLAKDK